MDRYLAVGRGFISFAKEYQSDDNRAIRENSIRTLLNAGFSVTIQLRKSENPKYTIIFPAGEYYSDEVVKSLNEVSPFLLEGKITFCKSSNIDEYKIGYTMWRLYCSYGKEWEFEPIDE